MYEVIVRNDPARRLAAVAHHGPYPQIGQAFQKLAATIGARGLFGQIGTMVGVYYDNPDKVAPADLQSHAAFVVQAGTPIEAPLEEVLLPSGRHAVMLVKGPYLRLPAAYQDLFGNWLPQSGEEVSDDPTFEIYLNSPMDTSQEELLTEICVPLKG